MKKKILLISGMLLTFSIIITILFTNNDKTIQSNIAENNNNEINNDMLTLMYETGIDTNEYEESTSNTWPDDNYIFNKELSGCENGGELSWNQQTNKITLLNNTSDRCYIYFDVYNKAVIKNITSSVTTNSITVNVSAIVGENPISRYYYSINDGEYIESAYNSYTFSNLRMETTYDIKVYVVDTLGISSTIYNVNIQTDSAYTLANYIINNVYIEDGVNGLYYHDGVGTYTNSDEETKDNSYRYSGADPNNYVCFGSEENVCSEDNLYRIIGVFGDQVKLIKYTSIGNYYWSGSSNNSSNVWKDSSLNTNILNIEFLNLFSSDWQDKIAVNIWKSGCNYFDCSHGVPNSAYEYEVGIDSDSNETYNAKIGLMYIHDYGYAADPQFWNTLLYYYEDSTSSNWLFLGVNEWTISRIDEYDNTALYVHNTGFIWDADWYTGVNDYLCAVRPVFYLNSDVIYVSGSGTSSDPFRIN